jgi:hypothetical protein
MSFHFAVIPWFLSLTARCSDNVQRWVRYVGNVGIRTQLLHSSVNNRFWSLSHCLLLKVVRPEQPNSPSSFRGVIRIPVYLFFRGDLRSTATSAPSLKPPRPERLPNKVSVSPDSWKLCFHIRSVSYSFALTLSLLLGRPVLLHYRLLLHFLYLFPFWRGSTPPQCPVFDVPWHDVRSAA